MDKNKTVVKLLLMGDRHNTETAPPSRIGDFRADCGAKDDFIIALAKKEKVDAIVHPGDFWNDVNRKPSNKFIGEVASRWADCGIPVIGIAGNHDMIGGDPETVPFTVAGLLDSLHIFPILRNGEEYHIRKGGIDFCITGTSFHKTQDKSESIGDYIVPVKKGTYHMHVVHGMLTPTDLGQKIEHTLITDIQNTAADITFCGHDHLGFGDIELNGKHYINPGAVVRMTCAEREFLRAPAVMLVTADENGIRVDTVPLPARPAGDVLSRDAAQAEKDRLNIGEEVRRQVAQLRLGGTVLQNVLDDIYARDAIDGGIRKDIQDIVVRKTASLRERVAAPAGAKIVRVTLRNFQSHADTEIRPASGFNVVLGESHNGKSALLRGIRWVAENKPAGKSVIRIGAKEGYAEVELENGTVIRRFASDTDNGYHIAYPDGTVRDGNTKLVPEVQRLMGWIPMPIGTDEEVGINHMSQSASPMLIGDNYSGTDRSRIIGAINNTDGIDAAVDEYMLENSRANDERKHEAARIDALNANIEESEKEKAGLDAACSILRLMAKKETIAESMKLLDEQTRAQDALDALTAVFDERKINDLLGRVRELRERQRSISKAADQFSAENAYSKRAADIMTYLESAADVSAEAIRKTVERKSRIEDAANAYAAAVAASEEYAGAIIGLEPFAAVPPDEIRRKIERKEKLAEHFAAYRDAIKISAGIADIAARLELPPNVTPEAVRAKVTERMERRKAILTASLDTQKAETARVKCDEALEQITRQHRQYTDEKAAILKASGVCPLCHSHLDEAAIATAIVD